MESNPHPAQLNVVAQNSGEPPASLQMIPDGQGRQCPYCYENISLHARKCWRCHEYFSPPREDLDDRAFQLARREVLQDCVADIKKWITRIGCGSAAGIVLVAALSMMRFQDVLQDLVSDRVEVVTAPVLEATEEKLGESEQVLDSVQDNIRLAQHRIAQFDRLDDQIDRTESSVQKVEEARQGLETRAHRLANQFEKLENRLINAKRELRVDHERRLGEMLGSFANRVITFDKLHDVLANNDTVQNQQLLSTLAPIELRRISLISPFTLSPQQPAVVFAPSVRLEWQFEGFDVGEIVYRVHFDTQRDFQSGQAQRETTRLANCSLPPDFPRGPIYWRVEAIDRNEQVLATSDVGYFEFYANSIDRIRSTGVIRVGVAVSSQGDFAYFDEEQGRLTGYDIELARWLSARLLPDMPLVQPVFMGYNWNRLLESVHRNEVDFIISTITITPEREEEFGLKFSRPYYKTFQACVVLREGVIRSAAHLQGRRIAVQAGTSSETVGEAFTEPGKLHRAVTSEIAFEELLRGQVDAVITDLDFAQGEVRNLGRPARVIALQEADFPETYAGGRSEDYGIAVAKPEVDLMVRINNALDAARSHNVLQTLKAQFVTREQPPTVLRRLPTPDLAMPLYETWPGSTIQRR